MSKFEFSRWRLALFVSPQVPIHALGIPFVVMLPPFYATEMGLGLVVVSQMFFLARISDVFFDLGFGLFSDRLRPRWGRRRPWMMLGMPLMTIAVWRLFLPPESVTQFQLLGTLLVFYTGWTLVALSHYAWGSEISDDYDGRSRVQGAKQIAIVGGIASVLLLTAIVEGTGGSRLEQMHAMGVFSLVLLPLTVIAAVFTMGERTVPPHDPITLKQAFLAVRNNRALRFVVAADLLVNINGGLTGALFIFFAKFFLEVGDQSATLLFIYFLAGIVGIPIWTQIAVRYGKRRCFIYHCIYNIAILPIFLMLPKGDFWFSVVGFVIFGVNYGTSSILLRAMMSDVIDVDRLETGQDRSGLYFALLTLTAKIGLAAPLIIAYPVLSAIGFNAAGTNSPEAISVLAGIYIFVPLAVNVIGIVVMRRFPIDAAQQALMRAEITKRTAARLGRI